jgi:hypothetical protein
MLRSSLVAVIGLQCFGNSIFEGVHVYELQVEEVGSGVPPEWNPRRNLTVR